MELKPENLRADQPLNFKAFATQHSRNDGEGVPLEVSNHSSMMIMMIWSPGPRAEWAVDGKGMGRWRAGEGGWAEPNKGQGVTQ